jgi:hypothetical protein
MLVSSKHGDQFSTQKQTKVSNLWKLLEAKDRILIELVVYLSDLTDTTAVGRQVSQ